MLWVEPGAALCVCRPWDPRPVGQQVNLWALMSSQETQQRVWAAFLAPLQPVSCESVCREGHDLTAQVPLEATPTSPVQPAGSQGEACACWPCPGPAPMP